MEWCLTRTTCATSEAAVALPDYLEDRAVGVGVLDVRTTSTQVTPGKIEMAEVVVVTKKGLGEMTITGKVLFSFARRFASMAIL